MSQAAVRSAIQAIALTVPAIGIVHAYERYAHDLARLKQLYVSPSHGQIRGWFIRRTKTEELCGQRPSNSEITTWQIRGVMALDDANQSELVFDDLIESLRDVFRENSKLNDTVERTWYGSDTGGESGLQLLDAGPVMFGGVLCHGARLSLTATRLHRMRCGCS